MSTATAVAFTAGEQPNTVDHPVFTASQCARLGITPARAAEAAKWARSYGPLTDDQRERLRAVLHPHGNRS